VRNASSSGAMAKLLNDGYCIIPDILPTATLAALDADLVPVFEQTPFGHGNFYGFRTKRFGGLLKRSAHAEELVMAPTILSIANEILGAACDRIQLNVAQAIEIHPGAPGQFPHRDHDMWGGAKGTHEYLLNVMWPLTPFTKDNGATLIYPFSHGMPGLTAKELVAPVAAEAAPGSAICFLGSTVHGAGANITKSVRRGVVVGYSLGWLKPYENLWLVYPPDIARHLPSDLAALVGYAQHRPNLGNYEGQCPSILLGDDVPLHIGAIDALRPDQEETLAEFVRNAERTR
jgi:hypothetical protein